MGKFTTQEESFFGATLGAYSIVTPREFIDSQITIDQYEKAVLHNVIPTASIPRMRVRGRTVPKFKFKLFGGSKVVSLNINYPKSTGNETRLYISSNAGFKPNAGEIWFIFHDGRDLVLGSMDTMRWSAIGGSQVKSVSNILNTVKPCFDKDDDKYQRVLHGLLPSSRRLVTYKKDNRVKSVATSALSNANFSCEIDPSHNTFLSTTGQQYVEAHHLVPLSKQSNLQVNLDRVENIVALCPTCHRAVHYSEITERLNLLRKLYTARCSRLKSVQIDVTLAELSVMYKLL